MESTPIQLNKGVLLGLNWGGGGQKNTYTYESQKSMPTPEEFKRDLMAGSYSFLTRSKHYLERYPKIDIYGGQFNYTNLCLFRTPKEKNLLAPAMQVVLRPLKS